MIIFSRSFIIPESYNEVCNIIKSCSFYIPKCKFEETAFSMRCARNGGGNLSLFRVSGTIITQNETYNVSVHTHADFSFFLGCILCFFGAFGLIGCLMSYFTRIYAALGCFAIGLIILIGSLTVQKDILDNFEQKFRTQLQTEITISKKRF